MIRWWFRRQSQRLDAMVERARSDVICFAPVPPPASMVVERACSTCRFAELTIEGDEPRVECRRFPPNVVGLPDDSTRAGQLWPVVGLTDWCGEYAAAPEGRVEP